MHILGQKISPPNVRKRRKPPLYWQKQYQRKLYRVKFVFGYKTPYVKPWCAQHCFAHTVGRTRIDYDHSTKKTYAHVKYFFTPKIQLSPVWRAVLWRGCYNALKYSAFFPSCSGFQNIHNNSKAMTTKIHIEIWVGVGRKDPTLWWFLFERIF